MSNPFVGVFYHSVGGLAAASFYTPYRKVRQWAWESCWLIQSVAAWIIMPWVAGALTVRHLPEVLANSPVHSLALVYLFGMLWGVGSLTFGLALRYLGMSLGYALALGFCAVFGTLVPPIVDGEFLAIVTTRSGLTVLMGVLVCLAGIAICGYAGIRKERELTGEQKREAIPEFALVKGFAVALFAGVMSACMALGINAGKPIARAAFDAGVPSVYQNNPVFIVIMAGSFTTNFLWCLSLNLRNNSIRDYVNGSVRLLTANYALTGLAGVIGYGQFFFYGIGTTKMGQYDFSSWTIHMAFIIVFSNLWGMYFKEWKGAERKTVFLVWTGLLVLTLATIVIGLGNYLAGQ